MNKLPGSNQSHPSCAHTPNNRVGMVSPVLAFIFHKSCFLDRYTGTAHCISCGETISVPKLYTHPALKTAYGLIAALLEYFALRLMLLFSDPFLGFLVTQMAFVALIILLITVTNAAILAHCPWVIQPKENDVILHERNKPSHHKPTIYASILFGFYFAVYNFLGKDFNVILLAFSIVLLIVGLVKRKPIPAIISAFVLLYSTAAILCRYLWGLDVPILYSTVSAFIFWFPMQYFFFSMLY